MKSITLVVMGLMMAAPAFATKASSTAKTAAPAAAPNGEPKATLPCGRLPSVSLMGDTNPQGTASVQPAKNKNGVN